MTRKYLRHRRRELLKFLLSALFFVLAAWWFFVLSALWVALDSNNNCQEKPCRDKCGESPYPNGPVDGSGRCPELLEAAKYYRDHFDPKNNAANNTNSLKISMIQLVGKWPNDPEMERTMHQVFQHNCQILGNSVASTTAIVEPRDVSFARNYSLRSIPPAFWKMGEVHAQCSSSLHKTKDIKPDLVWFLDGDVMVMDPYARIEMLWAYHTHLSPMDMLFAHGRNGINSGIFIVNCTSPTAIKFLELWHVVALDLLLKNDTEVYLNHLRPAWYEQNALHYMLNTYQWRVQGSVHHESTNPQSPKPPSRIWDEHVGEYSYLLLGRQDDNEAMPLFSTRALRTRLRHTTQCALQTFPPSTHRNRPFTYSPGHFLLHTAGIKRTQRLGVLKQFLEPACHREGPRNMTSWQAAQAYLRTHPYTYEFNETFLDWEYPD